MTPQNNPGNPNTIFRDYFAISKRHINYEKTETGIVINAEVESSNKENLIAGLKKIKSLSELSAYNGRIQDIAYTESYPTVYNNPDLTDSSLEILSNIFGKEIIVPLFGVSPFSGDDFAYFQEEIDGVYFFLGASDFEKGIISLPHSPSFNVDEESIRNGVKYFSTLIINQLSVIL